jgi:hypothetical protein
MWLLGRGLFRPFGPVGLLIAAYRIWRRLPEARKREIKTHARALAVRVQQGVLVRYAGDRTPDLHLRRASAAASRRRLRQLDVSSRYGR